MPEDSTTQLQGIIDRWRAGEPAALNELLTHTEQRLLRLTRRMLRDFQRVKQFADTDDVLQTALLRLVTALRSVQPSSAREFFGLATLQIQRVLLDLARHYFGPAGPGNREAARSTEDSSASAPQRLQPKADSTNEPPRLTFWTEFQEQVGKLPDDEREVFGLLWYHGLTQAQAAEILQVDVRTIKRRWQAARLRLHQVLAGGPQES